MSEQTTSTRPAPPKWSPWALFAIIILVPAIVIVGLEVVSNATGLREDKKTEESVSPTEDAAHSDDEDDAAHSDDAEHGDDEKDDDSGH